MNELHLALRDDAQDEAKLLALIEAKPQLLQQEDDSWEGWMPLHNAARWGAPKAAVIAALEAFPDAAKIGSRGGYEPLHLAAMGGHLQVCEALVAVYPEGAFKKDNNGRTPLAEAREGGHTQIVDLILSLPGAREIDEAEQAMRAAQIEELMRPDGDEVISTHASDQHTCILAKVYGHEGSYLWRYHGCPVCSSVCVVVCAVRCCARIGCRSQLNLARDCLPHIGWRWQL